MQAKTGYEPCKHDEEFLAMCLAYQNRARKHKILSDEGTKIQPTRQRQKFKIKNLQDVNNKLS